MGVKKPVTVGQHYFEKQGDALAYFKHILWKYKIGERLDESDQADVRDLFALHKDAQQKSGGKIDHFIVMISDEGSRCLGIVRLDGIKVGFSYRRCITQSWE